jgi:hypothetical protein
LSSPSASIGDPDFQVLRVWIAITIASGMTVCKNAADKH